MGLTLLMGCTRASTTFTRALEVGGHHLTLVGRDIYSGRFTNSRIARQENELRCTSSNQRLLHQPFWPGPSWNSLQVGQAAAGLRISGPQQTIRVRLIQFSRC
ncbi:hypothetical protein [Deinococcus koreensis]|nr:hypothetical protein [Deinococcus koreensis]